MLQQYAQNLLNDVCAKNVIIDDNSRIVDKPYEQYKGYYQLVNFDKNYSTSEVRLLATGRYVKKDEIVLNSNDKAERSICNGILNKYLYTRDIISGYEIYRCEYDVRDKRDINDTNINNIKVFADTVTKYESIISRCSFLIPASNYRNAKKGMTIKMDLEQVRCDETYVLDYTILPPELHEYFNIETQAISQRFILMKVDEVDNELIRASRWKVYFESDS